MSFIHPFDHDYDDYVRLYRSLRRDGAKVVVPRPGDFCYLSDGPRLILQIDEYGNFGMPDTGGPITGGWTRGSYQAYRGGRDHVRARADYQESELRRWQKRTGRKHPARGGT